MRRAILQNFPLQYNCFYLFRRNFFSFVSATHFPYNNFTINNINEKREFYTIKKEKDIKKKSSIYSFLSNNLS